MAQIKDYVNWRGDIPFHVSPFNEVDNYIIAKIGVLDFTGIVPSDGTEVPLRMAMRQYIETYGDEGEYSGAFASKEIMHVMRRIPRTQRFGTLCISGFVSKKSDEEMEQFSALTVRLPDGTHYVTFRGTDDSIVAWKENLLMSIENEIPARKDALDYLKWAASEYEGDLIVGGHSKGGNLAVYAAACAPEEIQDRISAVYSNDGPGFLKDFVESAGYLRIRPKLHVLLPQHSMIGTLLIQDSDYTVVKSPKGGAAGHDGMTWEVLPTRFAHCESLTRMSHSFDDSLDKVMEKLSIDERKQLVNEMFDALAATGAKTLSDFSENRLKQAGILLGSYRRSPESRHFVRLLMELMLREITPDRIERVVMKERNKRTKDQK